MSLLSVPDQPNTASTNALRLLCPAAKLCEGGGRIFIFGSITMRCHPIYYFLNVFRAAHMSPVVRNGREKFVDVLASKSTFEKGYHNDLNYYHFKFTSTVWC